MSPSRSPRDRLRAAPERDPSIEALERVPLLSRLDARDLKALAANMQERVFCAGTAITTAGQSGVGFFVIEEGTATVSVGDRAVRTLGPGDHFGEIALIDKGARSADITTDTELRCLGMTSWTFRPFVRDHPDLAWSLMEGLAARLREAEASPA